MARSPENSQHHFKPAQRVEMHHPVQPILWRRTGRPGKGRPAVSGSFLSRTWNRHMFLSSYHFGSPTLPPFSAELCPSGVSSDFPVLTFQWSFLTHKTGWYQDIRAPTAPPTLTAIVLADAVRAQLWFVKWTNILGAAEAFSSDCSQLSTG